MYPTAQQPMYQGHWQRNYYTGYQPVEYPQSYYYSNNNYYNSNYYNRSTSSTSSSMDSLNDPYYYSHPMTAMPQVQDYRQIPSSEMVYFSHPGSPTYSPSRSPSYSPQPPTYSPPQSVYPSAMPYMNSNSFYPIQPKNYKKTIRTSPNKPNDDQKKEFYIGMKPAERLQWIREAFPKQAPPTKESSKAPWESAAPVKPLRRPRMSTIKN